MKRKIAALVVFIAIAVMSISGTMAYFTADSVATNVITAGNIDIELHETQLDPETKTEVPFVDQTGVMPGQQVSKIVRVENTGGYDAYVRISVAQVVTLENGDVSVEGNDLITCDFNTEYWTKGEDGFYYYNEALEPGAFTEPLFENVIFSTEMGNEFQNSRTQLDVNVYAVQVKNNGATVMEAAGWPAPIE